MYHQPARVSIHKTFGPFSYTHRTYRIFWYACVVLTRYVRYTRIAFTMYHLSFTDPPLRLPTFSAVYFPALTQRGYYYFPMGSASCPPSAQTLPFLSTIKERKPGRSKYLYLLTSLSPPSYYTGDLSLANPLHRGRICRYSVSLSRDQGL